MSAVGMPTAAAPVRAEASARETGRGGRPAGAGGGGGGALAVLRVPSAAETALALGVVAVVALLVMPLAPAVLDVLLALSFGLSLVVLLVTVSSRDPIEFNVFPSLLLLLTLFRLGLNVSSTRLILSSGHAGQVIAAFGNFVIGGNIVVGLVIFLILVVINFMVITKGAGRIAEVAARFTLDAMPGRQMSIDADLSAGLIDEAEARRRREEIARYSDFYGSMDGAAKFVRGDAIAGLVITGVNLVGGFVIGMTQRGMSAGESLRTFSALTIGDGLVTQIPALIVSTAAGLLVTYGTGGRAMGPSMATQLTRNPQPLWAASGIMGLFAMVPGLPALPFLALSVALGVGAWTVGRRAPAAATADADTSVPAAPGDPAAQAPALREVLAVEPLEVEVGYGLVPLIDETQGGDLLQRIGIMRKQLALELGMLVPAARIRDNIRLAPGDYAIKVRGVRVAGSQLMPRHRLALDTRGGLAPIEGVPTREPSFDLPAVWIDPSQVAAAEAAGYVVVEPQTVLVTHLTEVVREHAADLLSRQSVRELLDGLKETHPALVEDVVPNKLSLGGVQRVLQRLLKEGIPVRDLVTILESLSDAADQTKDPEQLAEYARRAQSTHIAQALGADQGALRAITVGPALEVALMQLFAPRARDTQSSLDARELSDALHTLTRLCEGARRDGQLPPLVAPPALRVGIRRLLEPILPRLPVISLAELPPQTPIEPLAIWELQRAA